MFVSVSLIVPKQRKIETAAEIIPRILQNSSMLGYIIISRFTATRRDTCSHVAITLLRIHDPPIKLAAVVVTGLPRSAYIHVVADDEEAAASSMSAEGLSPSLFSANALVLRGLSLRRRRGPCARLFSRVPQPSSSNALHPPHATCLPTKLEKRRGSAGCVCFHLDPHTMCTRKDPTTRVPATFAIVYRATTVPQSCGGGCGGGNGDRLCELTRILHPETANEH